jgi:hypothetical protein
MKYLITAALVLGAVAAAPANAAPTVYGSLAAFSAATTGVSTTDFEGQPAGTGTWLFAGGNVPYAFPGLTISQTPNPASIYWNAFRNDPAVTPYYYNWGTGDVINTPYGGTLTITFNTAVTAFSVDLGSFYDDGLSSTPAGAPSTLYGKDVTVGTAQGSFLVDLNSSQTLKFFGVTSDTAFTSFTITGIGTDATASTVLDNVRFGSASAAAVPEPATWAMMIVGFGMVGAGMRRRQAKTTVAFG